MRQSGKLWVFGVLCAVLTDLTTGGAEASYGSVFKCEGKCHDAYYTCSSSCNNLKYGTDAFWNCESSCEQQFDNCWGDCFPSVK